MATHRARARLVTSHPIEAYGGIQLDESIVRDVADAVATGSLPMHFQHDITRPVDISNVRAGTERLDDGYLAAWAEFDVDSEAWEAFQDEVKAAGGPGGMSVSFTGPLTGAELASTSSVVVAADAHHFTEDEILEAVTILTRLHDSAGGERLYQFASEPLPKVVLDVVLPVAIAVGPSLAAAIIYDAAKSFFKLPRKGLIFNLVFRKSRKGTKSIQVHIEVHSEAELQSALKMLPAILNAGTEGTFTSSQGEQLRPIEGGDDTDGT